MKRKILIIYHYQSLLNQILDCVFSVYLYSLILLYKVFSDGSKEFNHNTKDVLIAISDLVFFLSKFLIKRKIQNTTVPIANIILSLKINFRWVLLAITRASSNPIIAKKTP